MILENLKIFLKLFYRPHGAMSEAVDKADWIFAAVAVVVVSFVFQFAVNSRIAETYAVSRYDYYQSYSGFENSLPNDGRLTPEQLAEAEYYANLNIEQEMQRERRPLPIFGKNAHWFFAFDSANFLGVLLTLVVFYVPATILLLTLFEPIGNFSLVLRRDYGVFSTCTLLAWAAAHSPFAVVGLILQNNQAIDGGVFLGLWVASSLFFGVLMIFAMRTVFGAKYRSAAATVCLSWLSMSAGINVFRYISPYLFSPFLLFYAFAYFRGEVGTLGNAMRQRQNFRRFLNNATVNPKDADAHVQLGLIYKQRRQTDEALKHFQKAFEIDKNEIDANYELGKLARERGELQAAIGYFSTVVEQNDKHATSEIWREIGATYLAAGMMAEARDALEKFVERRPFDAEGLYHLGKVLKSQGDGDRAREMFQSAVEAAQTSPDYRRREIQQWGKLARKEI